MQSLLSPPLLIVGLLLAVALITVAFLLILRTLQGGLRQKLTEQLNPGETLLAEDFRASFWDLSRWEAGSCVEMAWFIPEPARWKGILDTELTRRR